MKTHSAKGVSFNKSIFWRWCFWQKVILSHAPCSQRFAGLGERWVLGTREKARKGQVKLIFVQRENTGRSVQQVARQTGLHVVTIDPLSGQWMQQMDLISKSLAQ